MVVVHYGVAVGDSGSRGGDLDARIGGCMAEQQSESCGKNSKLGSCEPTVAWLHSA